MEPWWQNPVTDDEGNLVAVILELDEFQQMIDGLEELARLCEGQTTAPAPALAETLRDIEQGWS